MAERKCSMWEACGWGICKDITLQVLVLVDERMCGLRHITSICTSRSFFQSQLGLTTDHVTLDLNPCYFIGSQVESRLLQSGKRLFLWQKAIYDGFNTGPVPIVKANHLWSLSQLADHNYANMGWGWMNTQRQARAKTSNRWSSRRWWHLLTMSYSITTHTCRPYKVAVRRDYREPCHVAPWC